MKALKECLISLLAVVALTGVAVSAGGGLEGSINVSAIKAQQNVAEGPAPYMPGNGGYARGFIHKDLPADKWVSLKNVKADIPNTLDLRPKLTQIENQGSCGSCWAFSLTATHRDGHALGGKDPGRLSQEWMVEHSTYAAGCKGGYFDSANDFVAPGGQPLWSACPYSNGGGSCPAVMPFAASIKSWFMMGEKGTKPTVK